MSALAAALVLLLAAVAAIESARLVRNARRGLRINRALHELRRPLQSMALALSPEGGDLRSARACFEQARDALADLDAAVNGRTRTPARVRVALSELAVALEDRWRLAGVRVDPPGGGEVVDADPGRLGAALDNLVANALRHGHGPVRVRALTGPGVARFEVSDSGPRAAGAVPDPRRGHGLRLAAGVAAGHGGVVVPPHRSPGGETIAALSLPTASPERPNGLEE
jgi:signal transduction histidine kinase